MSYNVVTILPLERQLKRKVFLPAIYDKSEQEDIPDKEIGYLLSFIQETPPDQYA